MKFFEECRPEFYMHGGRLIKEKKTGRKYWRLRLVITCKGNEIVKCDDVISNCYLAIETRENRIDELVIAALIHSQSIDFFPLSDSKAPAFRVANCDLTDLRMTRVDDMTELWVNVEIENSDRLHVFVRDYMFSRLWAEFASAQMKLGDPSVKAAS
jgi:hypothetical protein